MIRKLTLFSVTALFFAFLVVPQTTDALSITPAIREISLTPGESKSAEVIIENETAESVTVTTEVTSFIQNGETGVPLYQFDAAATEAEAWVDVLPTFDIEANGSKTINVNFNPPADATPGGHYIGVLFTEEGMAMEAEGESELDIEGATGLPFLMTVSGDYDEKGRIHTFIADDTNYATGPVNFMVKYENTGDVHLKPTGSIKIFDVFGKEVATLAVNPEAKAVLPDSVRRYFVEEWDDVGKGFGKYTAELTMTTGTITNTYAINFWIMSPIGWVVIMVILAVLFFVIMMLIRSSKAKKAAPPSEPMKQESPKQEPPREE